MTLKRLVIICLLSISISCTAQTIVQQKSAEKELSVERNIFIMNMGYGYNVPFLDLKKIVNSVNNLTFELEYFMGESNLSLIGSTHLLFDQIVKKNVLSPIAINNFVIGSQRSNALISLDFRGISIQAGMSYLFNFKQRNAIHGIKVGLLAGYLEHFIRIQDDTRIAVQVIAPYEKGYQDRTAGISFQPFAAYRYYAFNNRLNFEVGVKNIIGFTQNVYGYNYYNHSYDEEKTVDIMSGIYATIGIPLFTRSKNEQIYY